MRTERKSALHLWIASLAILGLAVFYPLETLTARQAAIGTETAFSLPAGYYDHDIQLEIVSSSAAHPSPLKSKPACGKGSASTRA